MDLHGHGHRPIGANGKSERFGGSWAAQDKSGDDLFELPAINVHQGQPGALFPLDLDGAVLQL
jgi:hypothetical protein